MPISATKCQKQGHIASVCQSRARDQGFHAASRRQALHQLTEEALQDDEQEELFQIKSLRGSEIYERGSGHKREERQQSPHYGGLAGADIGFLERGGWLSEGRPRLQEKPLLSN